MARFINEKKKKKKMKPVNKVEGFCHQKIDFEFI